MKAVAQPLPAEWAEPPASSAFQLRKFRMLGSADRARVARRAYDIYLCGRVDQTRCWAAALGEQRMNRRRGDLW